MFDFFIIIFVIGVFFALKSYVDNTNEKIDQLIRTISVMETLIDRLDRVEYRVEVTHDDLEEMHKQMIVFEHMNKKKPSEKL